MIYKMENLFVLIVMGLGGMLFVYLGYLIWIKKKIHMIHDSHWTKVKESDKKAYTSIMGKAMIIMGIGMILSGIMCMVIYSAKCGIVFGISFILGLGMMIYAQIKYNHGIF